MSHFLKELEMARTITDIGFIANWFYRIWYCNM